jgi:hypothetical protein
VRSEGTVILGGHPELLILGAGGDRFSVVHDKRWVNMVKMKSEFERQKKIVLNAIPDWFYESLGPYEYQRFYHTFAEIKSAELGRMEVKVVEISLQDASYSDLIFPDELFMTIWPDVTCKWDPQELISTISTNRVKSLQFEIEPSIDFDTVYLDAEIDEYEIRDDYLEFVAAELIDHCMYALDRDERELGILIEKQPLSLRPMIREKCRKAVETIKSEESGKLA